MFESWVVGVAFRATSNVARVMAQTGAATNSTNNAIARQNALLKQQEERARRARAAIAGGLAIAGAVAITAGIRGAADLQSAMTSVGIATGLAENKLGDFYKMAVKVSGITAQGVTTIAQEMAIAASSGLNNPNRLRMAFPQIAKAADILYLSPKKIDPTHGAQALSQFAHLFGAYQPGPLHEMIDKAVRAMYVQPEGIDRMVNQGRMFIGPALAYGVSMKDIFTQLALMGQTGFLQGRGGSGIANVINYIMGGASLTGFQQKKRRSAMEDLGLADKDGRLKSPFLKNGHLQLQQVIDYLGQLQKQMSPGQFGTDLYNAFGVQGQRYLLTVTRPEVFAQMRANETAMNRIAPQGQAVETLWSRYMNNFWGKWNYAISNAHNILVATFLPILPRLTRGLNTVGGAFGHLADWLMIHPRAAAAVAVAAFGATATAAIYSARQVWLLNASIIAMGRSAGGAAVVGGATKLGIIGRLGAFIGSLFSGQLFRTALMSILLRGGWVATLIGGIVQIGSKVIPVVGWILAAVAAIGAIVGLVRNGPQIATAVHNWWTKNQYQIGYTIGTVFASIGKMIQNAIMGLVSGAWAAVKTAATNVYLLATPAGQATLWQMMAVNAAAAQQQWDAGPGSRTFMAGLQSGWGSVYGPPPTPGGAPSVNLYITDPNFHFPDGTNPQHAKKSAGEFFDAVLEHAKTATNAHSTVVPLHPFNAFVPARS